MADGSQPFASARPNTAPLRRPRGRDPLGLRRVMADRLLPLLVAAMMVLAALALAGAAGAAAVVARWQAGAAAAVTVQMPAGTSPERVDAALAALHRNPEVAAAALMDRDRLASLLRPWLGEAMPDLPMPLVIEVRLQRLPSAPAELAARIGESVPGALVEAHGIWVARLLALVRSVEALALAALGLVGLLATAVVAVAVRAGIAARREAIAVLHDLGATDGDIAGRFAQRAAWLTGLGALGGAAAAVPVLAALADLAAPLLSAPDGVGEAGSAWGRLASGLAALPWPGLAALPVLAAVLAWVAAQVTVRLWLRRLS
jgi:cell division transport system permease protein